MSAVFRAKGLVYIGAKTFYDQRVPGGSNAVASALGPLGLRTFYDQTFTAGGLYDALPIIDVSREAARLAGTGHATLVRENAAWLAKRDLRGVFKFIVAVASPMAVAKLLPRASMSYFDFGKAVVDEVSSNEVVARQQGLPAPLASWFLWAAEGFVPIALIQAGARRAVVVPGKPETTGERAGVEIVTQPLRISWS